jgi:urease alpha subunit
MVSVRSETTSILMSDGIDALSTGIIALMRSTVATTLAPGERWIGMMMARCLLYQAAIRLFSGPSTALPTSLTRTGEPLR